MHANNNRRHTRRACEVPLEILTEAARFSGRVTDASRSGVRLRIPGGPLGLYRMAPASLVGRQVGRILGIEFEARFHPERLGSLLSKRLRPVRIGQCHASSADLELGCVVHPPLTDDEAAMLGLSIPTLRFDGNEADSCLESQVPRVRSDLISPASNGRPAAPASPRICIAAPEGTAPAAVARLSGAPTATPRRAPAHLESAAAQLTEALESGRRSAAPASTPTQRRGAAQPSTATQPSAVTQPSAAQQPGTATQAGAATMPSEAAPRLSLAARETWRAYVHPSGTRRIPPFVARMESVSITGVEVKVLDRSLLNVEGGIDVASTMAALGDAYGSEVALRLVDGATHLWTGPARIEMVEVGQTAPYPVTLWLTYSRPLRAPERRALDLG